MAFRVMAYPEFSYSHSREKILDECARRYRHQYYGSFNGWLRAADPEARRLWTLKQLGSLPGMLGQEIHLRATEIAEAIRSGKEDPSPDELVQRTRAAMNRVWAACRDVEAFRASPKGHPMLQERYYGLPISNDRLVATRAKIQRCIEHLYTSPTWEEVRAAEPRKILLMSATEPTLVGGERVYAAPDLAYQRSDSRWVILDWKTGAEGAVDGQIAKYGLVLHARLNISAPIIGRVANLDTGTEREMELTDAELAGAKKAIADGIYSMRGWIVDMDTRRNEAHPLEKFPFPVDASRCRWCNYFEVCEPELAKAEHMGPF